MPQEEDQWVLTLGNDSMARIDFNRLTWFRMVAEERSFTRAAAKLGVATR